MNHLNSKPDTVWRSQNAVFSAASKLFVILNVTYWCRTTLMKHIVRGVGGVKAAGYSCSRVT